MEKRVQDYTQDILAVVRSNTSPAAMSDKLGDFHANDIADAMPRLTVQERCKLYRILELDMLSDIFEYTDSDNAAEYVKEMDVKKGAAILSRMETDALVEVLHKIDKAKKKLLFELMDDDVRHDIEMIASFDEDEIGSRMTTNCIIIRENLTVKQAMNSLVEQAAKNDNISTIFVVTESQKFYGAIDLKDLIIARQDKSLEDLVATSYPYVYAEEDIDDCIEELKAYSEDSIPVLDNDNRFLGVITSSNIIDLVDDEMGEDYAMLAGLTAEEDLKEPLKESMKKRMPWLIVLLGLGIVDGGGPRRHGDGGASRGGGQLDRGLQGVQVVLGDDRPGFREVQRPVGGHLDVLVVGDDFDCGDYLHRAFPFSRSASVPALPARSPSASACAIRDFGQEPTLSSSAILLS